MWRWVTRLIAWLESDPDKGKRVDILIDKNGVQVTPHKENRQ